MKKIFSFTILSLCLLLVSCSKDEQVTPQVNTDKLTGMADKVNDAVWGESIDSRAEGGNYVSIGSTIEFQDNSNGAVISFEVVDVEEFTSYDELPGEGVKYIGVGHSVTAIEPDGINRVLVNCYVGDRMACGQWFDY